MKEGDWYKCATLLTATVKEEKNSLLKLLQRASICLILQKRFIMCRERGTLHPH